MAKRVNNEGSIYKRADGRWCGQVLLGCNPNGTPRRKMVYGATQAAAKQALERIKQSIEDGVDIQTKEQTIAAYLGDWLENTVRPKNKQLTYRSYEWIVRIHLIPALGKLTLSKLTPQKHQAFLNQLSKAGLSPATVKHVNATLRAALSQAQRWQLVRFNGAKLVTLPRGVRYQATILTPDQSKQFLTSLIGQRYEALFTIALTMGLRRGEMLGLRWADIDFTSGMLHVRHSLERVKGEGVRLAEPKSAKAKRSLRIPQVALTALIAQRRAQEIQRQWSGSKWREAGFIFTTNVGTPVSPDDVTQAFPLALAAAGLPKVRFHDLRHSCASLLLSLGVHPKLVRETLGHSSFQLTMDTYSHMIPALRNEVADKMDEIFQKLSNEAVKPEAQTIN
jgi:integrase